MLIAIPSKGRAGNVPSAALLPDPVLYVPAAEAEDYERDGLTVVAVPNEIKGITPTRNYILESTDDRHVVMVDDDVKHAGWVELLPHTARHRTLTPYQFGKQFAQAFDVCEGLCWKVWGAKTESAPRSVYPWKPFVFRTYVTASCMGIINDGSYRFDERFTVKEDYEIGLRHIREFGGVLGVRYWYWENGHWTDDGGCKAYRTHDVEERCIALLMQMYPGMVRRITRGGSQYSIEVNV